MAMIYIDGVEMPSPAEFSVEFEDVGDMGRRNALGQRLVDRVAVKRIITVSWPRLDREKAALIMAAACGNVFFEAGYHDPETGEMRTGTFRVVSRSAVMHRAEEGGAVWAQLDMKWEER